MKIKAPRNILRSLDTLGMQEKIETEKCGFRALLYSVDKLQFVVKDLEAKIMRLQSLTCRDYSLSSPEKERCTEVHDSLEVSQVLQDREELSVSSVPSSPLSPLETNPTICEWCYCSFKTCLMPAKRSPPMNT